MKYHTILKSPQTSITKQCIIQFYIQFGKTIFLKVKKIINTKLRIMITLPRGNRVQELDREKNT